jgi:hypothetical protein
MNFLFAVSFEVAQHNDAQLAYRRNKMIPIHSNQLYRQTFITYIRIYKFEITYRLTRSKQLHADPVGGQPVVWR